MRAMKTPGTRWLATSTLLLALGIPEVRAEEKYPVLDLHVHVMMLQNLIDAAEQSDFGAHRKTTTGIVTDPKVLLTKTIESMDANNIRKAMVFSNQNMIREWVSAYPDRFLVSYQPGGSADNTRKHQAAAAQFEKEIDQNKWVAMGELGLAYQGRALNDPAYYPYYEVCERKGLPVFFHTGGPNGPDPQRMFSERFRVELADPLLLQDVVARFPKLKIVLMHMGWPYADNALYMLYSYPNVYLEISGVNWLLGPSLFNRLLREAVETGGSDRILFGSDAPLWPQFMTAAVDSVRKADFLTPEDKRKILWDNAAALLKVK
jgi:predicted TIM-barrel fold metal-dependent hydrolase